MEAVIFNFCPSFPDDFFVIITVLKVEKINKNTHICVYIKLPLADILAVKKSHNLKPCIPANVNCNNF